MDVSARIKELLKTRGWTVHKLAYEAGLTTSTLYSIMDGTNKPTIATIENLCEALDISLSDFFRQSNDNSDEDKAIQIMYNKLSQRDKHIIRSLLSILNDAQ